MHVTGADVTFALRVGATALVIVGLIVCVLGLLASRRARASGGTGKVDSPVLAPLTLMFAGQSVHLTAEFLAPPIEVMLLVRFLVAGTFVWAIVWLVRNRRRRDDRPHHDRPLPILTRPPPPSSAQERPCSDYCGRVRG